MKLTEQGLRTGLLEHAGKLYMTTLLRPGLAITSLPGKGVVTVTLPQPECPDPIQGETWPTRCNLGEIRTAPVRPGQRVEYFACDPQGNYRSIYSEIIGIDKDEIRLPPQMHDIDRNCGAAIYVENGERPGLYFAGMRVCEADGTQRIVPADRLLTRLR